MRWFAERGQQEREPQKTVAGALAGASMRKLGVEWPAATQRGVATAAPATPEGACFVERARASAHVHPRVFVPPTTPKRQAQRHPWHGEVGEITFGELAAGVGVFAAAFVSAGARCAYVVEPNDEKRQRAIANAGGDGVQGFRSVFDVDPADLPWTHVLVAGPE